jgi:hypothetical protein
MKGRKANTPVIVMKRVASLSISYFFNIQVKQYQSASR